MDRKFVSGLIVGMVIISLPWWWWCQRSGKRCHAELQECRAGLAKCETELGECLDACDGEPVPGPKIILDPRRWSGPTGGDKSHWQVDTPNGPVDVNCTTAHGAGKLNEIAFGEVLVFQGWTSTGQHTAESAELKFNDGKKLLIERDNGNFKWTVVLASGAQSAVDPPTIKWNDADDWPAFLCKHHEDQGGLDTDITLTKQDGTEIDVLYLELQAELPDPE